MALRDKKLDATKMFLIVLGVLDTSLYLKVLFLSDSLTVTML